MGVACLDGEDGGQLSLSAGTSVVSASCLIGNHQMFETSNQLDPPVISKVSRELAIVFGLGSPPVWAQSVRYRCPSGLPGASR